MSSLSGAIQSKVVKIESELTTKALDNIISTEDQTPFMRKLKIQAHVGGWIVEFVLTKGGLISRFKTEWIPFYDKGFYDKAWKYK